MRSNSSTTARKGREEEDCQLASMDVNNSCFKMSKENGFANCLMLKEMHATCLLGVNFVCLQEDTTGHL